MRKPKGYWTIEKVGELAINCVSRTEFFEKYNAAYSWAQKRNLLDVVCAHMKNKNRKIDRYIYVFEFNDKHVYIGLTWNYNKRIYSHLKHKKKKNSAVYKHIKKTKLLPKFKLLTKEKIDEKIAAKLETMFIKTYRKNGWVILNKTKGGQLGGNNRKWDDKKIKKEALKYQTKKEFKEKASGAYQAALRYNLIDEVCSHMFNKKKPPFYWTEEKLIEETKKYNRKSELKKHSQYVYHRLRELKYLNK